MSVALSSIRNNIIKLYIYDKLYIGLCVILLLSLKYSYSGKIYDSNTNELKYEILFCSFQTFYFKYIFLAF